MVIYLFFAQYRGLSIGLWGWQAAPYLGMMKKINCQSQRVSTQDLHEIVRQYRDVGLDLADTTLEKAILYADEFPQIIEQVTVLPWRIALKQ